MGLFAESLGVNGSDGVDIVTRMVNPSLKTSYWNSLMLQKTQSILVFSLCSSITVKVKLVR